MLDVKDFYASINEAVLQKALQFAKNHTKTLEKDIDLIIHARRSPLFNEGETWVKKIDENFDVTLGAYDGAEICELVGIYLLSLLSEITTKMHRSIQRRWISSI